MTCYDEQRERMTLDERIAIPISKGPTVVRDRQNVREISEDPAAFALHVRPRYKMGRDDNWGSDEG